MSYLIWSSDEEGVYRSQQPVPIPVNIYSAGKLGQIDKDEFLMEEPKPHFLTPKCSSLSPTSTSKDLLSEVLTSSEQSYRTRFLPMFKLSLKQLSTDIEEFEVKNKIRLDVIRTELL
ncbi:MAG: hypothetical protein ACYT04_44840 [Nostoc sp.]